jgi:hypothetical protein
MGLEIVCDLPTETFTVDLLRHAMVETRNILGGVSLSTILADVRADTSHAMARSYGDYTTNLPLNDLIRKAGVDRVPF